MKIITIVISFTFFSLYSCKKDQPSSSNTSSSSKVVACFSITSANPSLILTIDSVTFDASCSQNAQNYLWYVDNSEVNPSNPHQVTISQKYSAGKHTVLLVITGSSGTDSIQKSFSVVTADTHTINGSGFKNSVYNISNVAQQSSSYDVKSGLTTITISGASGDSVDIEYDITFAGNIVGPYTLAPTGNNVFTITITPIKNQSPLQIYTSNTGAKLNITNYDSVGGQVLGNFSGNFNRIGLNYTISNGTFRSTRLPDVH